MSNNWSAKPDQVSVWDICTCGDDIEECGFDLIIFLRKKMFNESKFDLNTLNSSGVITKIVQGKVAHFCTFEG